MAYVKNGFLVYKDTEGHGASIRISGIYHIYEYSHATNCVLCFASLESPSCQIQTGESYEEIKRALGLYEESDTKRNEIKELLEIGNQTLSNIYERLVDAT